MVEDLTRILSFPGRWSMAPRTRTKSVFWLSVISTMSKSSPVKEILICGKKKDALFCFSVYWLRD